MNDRFFLIAAALTLTAGCPTSSTDPDAASTDAAMSSDAAMSTDAAESADAPTPRPDREDPFAIAAIQGPSGDGTLQRSLIAIFSESPCDLDYVGPCVLTTCPTPPNDGGLPVDANLGTIRVSGGQLAAPMMLVPDPVIGSYRAMLNVTGTLFAPGDTVTFETVLGATSTNLTAPSTIAVTEPVLTEDVVVDRGSDLPFAWTADGSSSGNVHVSGRSLAIGPGALFLSCTFPVSEGTGVVPAAALQALRAGLTNIRVWTESSSVMEIEGIRTRMDLRNLDSGLAGSRVQLE